MKSAFLLGSLCLLAVASVWSTEVENHGAPAPAPTPAPAAKAQAETNSHGPAPADANSHGPAPAPAASSSGSAVKSAAADHAKWNYNSPDSWTGTCKDGKRQSPIELNFEDAVTSTVLKNDPLLFKNYNKAFPGHIRNDGHTVVWTMDAVPAGTEPTLVGSGFGPGVNYTLAQFHFHWGGDEEPEDSCFGADHLVEYETSPLEVHFVHRNTKYATIAAAMEKPDGLAVVGFLFDPTNDPHGVRNDYADVMSKLPLLSVPASEIVLSVDFTKLIPSSVMTGRSTFFRYEGSLTAPPCHESVTWTVFAERINITTAYLRSFRQLIRTESVTPGLHEVLDNNYRPIQRRNGRTIWTNGEGLGKLSSAQAQQPPSFFLSLALTLSTVGASTIHFKFNY